MIGAPAAQSAPTPRAQRLAVLPLWQRVRVGFDAFPS